MFVGWWALIPIAVGAAIWAIAKYWHKLPGYIQKPLIFIYVLLEAFAKYLYATLINPMIAFAKIMYYVFTGQFKKAWATAKDAVTSIIDPFLNIGKRYDELVKKSDKYTEEQNSGMDNIKSKTTNMANDIQSVMGNSLKITQQNFDATTITGQLSAVNIANAWDESSINMSNSMINSANMINEAINTIPSRIETVHETIEITSYGTSSGRSGATIGRDALGQPMTMIPTATPTATPKYVESKFPGVPGYYEYFQGGGWIPKTGPYMLHAGEYVNTIGKANGMGNGTIINLSPIYNVYVSDKREFEMMIKNNNNKLVEDLRRMIEI